MEGLQDKGEGWTAGTSVKQTLQQETHGSRNKQLQLSGSLLGVSVLRCSDLLYTAGIYSHIHVDRYYT